MCVVFVLLLESCRDVCSLCVTVGVLQRLAIAIFGLHAVG